MVIIFFKSKLFQVKQQYQTIRSYYSNPQFALIDLFLGFSSFFLNPYRTCRKYLEKRGVESVDAYGETPLSVFAQIAKEAEINSEDMYVELGSGRGKTCFWAAIYLRCQVLGVEWVPAFARLSKIISKLFRVQANFIQGSMKDVDLSSATVVYLYHLEDWTPRLSKGAKLITISEPVAGYKVIRKFSITLPWGITDVFIQIAL